MKCCFHAAHMVVDCAAIISSSSCKSDAGILLLLFATMHPPLMVNHTLVAPGDGLPLLICTWMDSLFSFDQKYILYPPMLNKLGNF